MNRLILEDLDSAYRVLVPQLEPLCGKIESNDQRTYTLVQAESIIIFHLKALTDIGKKIKVFTYYCQSKYAPLVPNDIVPLYNIDYLVIININK